MCQQNALMDRACIIIPIAITIISVIVVLYEWNRQATEIIPPEQACECMAIDMY